MDSGTRLFLRVVLANKVLLAGYALFVCGTCAAAIIVTLGVQGAIPLDMRTGVWMTISVTLVRIGQVLVEGTAFGKESISAYYKYAPLISVRGKEWGQERACAQEIDYCVRIGIQLALEDYLRGRT